MAKLIKLTHETLIELLDFDPATGVFTWKVARSNRVKVGSRAGVFHAASGGRYISIGDEKFMAHRLAFFYVNKRWPNTDVRPNDGDYDNCSTENLQEVSRVALQHGRSKIKTNTSGYQGVSAAKNGKWQSKITWNYKQISLGGNFDTAEEAGAAYAMALETLKTAKSEDDIRKAVADFRTEKRLRAAWENLHRSNVNHAFGDFADFCAEFEDIPDSRYALAPIDASLPIGHGNVRWALPADAIHSTRDGRSAYNKVLREANRDHHRGRDFRRLYGIDFGDYQRMLLDQKGVCAICEKPETKVENGTIRLLSVDHNHTTGAVRGLLCANCNLAIGYACDDVSVLEKAIIYLRKYGAPSNVVKFEPALVNGIMGNGT